MNREQQLTLSKSVSEFMGFSFCVNLRKTNIIHQPATSYSFRLIIIVRDLRASVIYKEAKRGQLSAGNGTRQLLTLWLPLDCPPARSHLLFSLQKERGEDVSDNVACGALALVDPQ